MPDGPMGYTKIFGRRLGLYTRGLYTKKFLMRIYTQKVAPTQGQKQILKKIFILHLQTKMGMGLYTSGLYIGITVLKIKVLVQLILGRNRFSFRGFLLI